MRHPRIWRRAVEADRHCGQHFSRDESHGIGPSISSAGTPDLPQSTFSDGWEQLRHFRAVAALTPLKSETTEGNQQAIASSQSLRWFVTSTVGPAHMLGVTFVSASGTAVNRPGEYRPHWTGFANRFGISMAGSAAGNAIEAGGGLLVREDPHYFRAPQQPFRGRIENVVRLSFSARRRTAGFKPAYARFAGIFGSNFLSNSWRVHSEANARNALLRSSEGFAGRMGANAFAEFWPDLKKYLFHGRVTTVRLENAD